MRKQSIERAAANPAKTRPRMTIDWKKADDLLEKGCLGTEVAAYFCMHPATFYRRVEEEKGITFTQYQQQKRSRGDSHLRSKQFEVAMEGDKSLLIWLGKQRLKQKEPTAEVITISKSSATKYVESQEKQDVNGDEQETERESSGIDS